MRNEVYKVNFGEVLKKLRSERGITQEKLAADLDIPESTIRRLEISNSIPRKERLNQIAKYFGVSTDVLLGIDIEYKQQDENVDYKMKEIDRLVRKITKDMGVEATEAFLKQLAREKD